MPLLTLSHVTRYTYRHSVSFGEHRIMVRPRESYDQHLVDAELHITPEPSGLRWLQDVFGNSVAIATFDKHAKELVFDSRVRLLHEPAELQDVDIEDYARFYPFTYSSEEMPDLLRSIERQHHDPLRQIDTWARRFVARDGRTDTLDIAVGDDRGDQARVHLCRARRKRHADADRDAGEAQGHVPRLRHADDRGGACAGVRGAVRVSGYVYNPSSHDRHVGGGNTHAWVRVYLPGIRAGVEFDPTNGIVGNRGLIRVAIARDLYQAVPISGTWSGFPGKFRWICPCPWISGWTLQVLAPRPTPFLAAPTRKTA